MNDLVWQAPAGVLGAFLLGLLFGWWLGSRKLHDRLDRQERKWRLKVAGQREALASCQRDLEACLAQGAALGEAPADEPTAAAVGDPQPAVVPAADDLTRIEGIGPKIQELLRAAGIDTWARLAASDVTVLRSLLDEAGTHLRVHDPSTWPRQAALAAEGIWDELKAFQARLKGGREVEEG